MMIQVVRWVLVATMLVWLARPAAAQWELDYDNEVHDYVGTPHVFDVIVDDTYPTAFGYDVMVDPQVLGDFDNPATGTAGRNGLDGSYAVYGHFFTPRAPGSGYLKFYWVDGNGHHLISQLPIIVDIPGGGGGGGTPTPGEPECSDNVDNDTDGKVDTEDPGCTDAADTSENTDSTPVSDGGIVGGLLNGLKAILYFLFVPSQAVVDGLFQSLSAFFDWGPFSLIGQIVGLASVEHAAAWNIGIPIFSYDANGISGASSSVALPIADVADGEGPFGFVRAILGGGVYLVFGWTVVHYLMPRHQI